MDDTSIYYEILNYIRNNKEKIDYKQAVSETDKIEVKLERKKDNFVKYIKNISNEEALLLKLQKQYRCGEI